MLPSRGCRPVQLKTQKTPSGAAFCFVARDEGELTRLLSRCRKVDQLAARHDALWQPG
jgi:hypothetical protein